MPTELVRVGDRLSFIYLERCVVNRDENAITATDDQGTVHLPAASIACLILGPGTRVTHAAMALLGDCGVSVVWAGEHGVRYYAHGSGIAKNARLLEQQAALVSNRRSRLRIARRMYQMRFPGEDVSSLTMEQLRGREGARVRSIYAREARRTSVSWTGRAYKAGDIGSSNPVNQSLTAANSALYGVVHSVIAALGCSPGLGFVHTGTTRSFVYDIADLYKAETTIPAAFDVVASGDPSPTVAVRRLLRDYVASTKMLERCTQDIQRLLTFDTGDADWSPDSDNLQLWDEKGNVDSGRLHQEEADS
ncbi:type I-E CRISPR-associated endonuclease Cas1e [Glutamicibacter sp. PS]|uniref:type I-E CRISPR-associated endonuclease Cas1e n=1 Tax=Glutamicibacter sp. PS TaxID=3075634 RepID=UPI00284A7A16|nr:type I-E CRISPR-associated endonuclease Cas1e [Glutamicibacter sp. PS]MDR4534010.1 type I-E CRISPR-associated endonuclease Cas1e [Glutamicibacter sp. PS]